MPPARSDSPVGSVAGRASRLVGPPRRVSDGSSFPLLNAAGPALGLAESAPDSETGAAEEDRKTPEQRRQERALETLLSDLGSQIQRGPSREVAEPPRLLATGIESLDALLGGGFPSGRLSEINGPPSSGRTALTLRLVQQTLAATDPGAAPLAAWIDWADAFDPRSALACGIDLERLLWVRPTSARSALRSCDKILQTEGFGLIVFDTMHALSSQKTQKTQKTRKALKARHRGLSGESRREAPRQEERLRDADWLRLARQAARMRTAIIVLAEPGRASSPEASALTTGSRAELALELEPCAARFETLCTAESAHQEAALPSLLETLEIRARLQRHRSKPCGDAVLLSLHGDAAP